MQLVINELFESVLLREPFHQSFAMLICAFRNMLVTPT